MEGQLELPFYLHKMSLAIFENDDVRKEDKGNFVVWTTVRGSGCH